MKIFIIHGAYGNSKENWFPWLKEKLEEERHEIIVPDFPTPENQSIDSWLYIFDKYLSEIDNNIILIGHSLGPAFILSILEKIKTKVKASIFVSAFIGNIGIDDFDKINDTFVNKDFNFNKIKNNCSKFILISSDNDPYVPKNKIDELAELLIVS